MLVEADLPADLHICPVVEEVDTCIDVQPEMLDIEKFIRRVDRTAGALAAADDRQGKHFLKHADNGDGPAGAQFERLFTPYFMHGLGLGIGDWPLKQHQGWRIALNPQQLNVNSIFFETLKMLDQLILDTFCILPGCDPHG